MALAFVANSYVADTSFNNVATAHVHSGTNSVVGDLLIIHVGWNDATTAITGVADTGATGAAWTKATGNAFKQGNGLSESIFYTKATSAAAYTVTATWPSNVPYIDLRLRAFNGFTGTPTLDQVAGGTGQSATAATGNSGTTTADAEVVVAGGMTNGGFNADAMTTGYTSNKTTPNSDISGYKIQPAMAVQSATNATSSSSDTWAITMATFKDVAAGGATIVPTGIGSGQSIGAHSLKLNRTILASGIASAQAIGTLRVNRYLIPTGVASGQAFGTSQLNRYVRATGIASAQSFGTSKVNRYVNPTGVASGQAFGTSTINLYLVSTGIASGQAFGTSKLDRYITTTGVATGESFGTHKFNRYILPSGLATSEVLGTLMLGMTVRPGGISSNETLGTAKLIEYLLPAGISSAQAFGTAKTIFTVFPTGISSSETLGSATLNFVIFPSGVVSRESVGAHLISVSGGPIIILPGGITTSELFGTHKLNFILFPPGIISSESIGSHLLSTTGAVLIIVPVGIATAQLFGTDKLNLFISATGLGSAESFGIHKINEYINPTGISTGESIGQIIIVGPKTILPVGIASGEAWGTIVFTIPYTKDWNELKAKIIYLLRTDTVLRGLLNKSTSPYGVYFSRPPVKPSFPLLTVRFIDEAMDVENNPQPRTIYVEFKAYSATNSDAILERVEEVINQSTNFRDMTEYKVSHAALDSIGPDDFDANFNIYTGSHQYVFFVDHHQRESWS